MEFLVEQRQLIVAEGARGQRDFVRLLDQGLQNFGMAVALVDGGIGGQAIEVALAFDVVDPDALGALDDDVERMIVVSSVIFFELDEILRLQSDP